MDHRAAPTISSPLVARVLDHAVHRGASFVGAMVIGTRGGRHADQPGRPAAGGRCWSTSSFFRNIPLLCLLFLVAFGLPDIGVLFNALHHAPSSAMAMFSGAFVCETDPHRHQHRPGRSGRGRPLASGLTFSQSMRFVILPQALRSMVQPLVNVWIGDAARVRRWPRRSPFPS